MTAHRSAAGGLIALERLPARRIESSWEQHVVLRTRTSRPEVRSDIRARAAAASAPMSVTVIGSLPPVKGVSAYTSELLRALSSSADVKAEFIGFRSIYPRWAYPGGEPAEDGAGPSAAAVGLRELPGIDVRSYLAWHNPLSWVRAGFGARGDVVHAQWWSHVLAPVYLTALGIARLRGKRIVITVHNAAPHEDGWLKRRLNGLVCRLGHEYIVHSRQNRDTMCDGGAYDAARVHVIPHGVLATPRTGISRATARQRLGLPAGAKVALCFGNIRAYKGIDVLLRGFADALREEPDALLVIAGKPWVDWSPYATLIDGLGIADNVRLFLEYVPADELEPLFVAADVVVLPYVNFEAQSGVGARALPFGRPLLVSETGGLPELVLDENAVVPPGDPAALSRALRRMLADAGLRDRMSVDSLTIAASLGWDNIAARTVEVYERAANREGLRDDSATPALDEPEMEPVGAPRP